MGGIETKTQEKQTPLLIEYAREHDAALSPEWIEQAPLLERNGNKNRLSVSGVFPDVFEYALLSSQLAADYERMKPYPTLDSTNRLGFVRHLKKHIGLYDSLTGIHSAGTRPESSRRLAEALRQHIDFNERHYQLTGEVYPGYQRWHQRLRANLLEDVGLMTGSYALLQEAIDVNDRIVNDPNISYTKSYKIHTAFSRFDMADALLQQPYMSRDLGLPTTIEELQAGYFDTLAEVTAGILTDASKKQLIGGPWNDIDGAVTELVVLGYLRDQITTTDSNQLLAARQSFINQDVGKASRLCNRENGIRPDGLPSFSYDLVVFQRDGGSRMKIEVKKSEIGVRGRMVNDTVRLILHKRCLAGEEFITAVHRFADAQTRRWRGESPKKGDTAVIYEMYGKLNFENARERLNGKLGREVLKLAAG